MPVERSCSPEETLFTVVLPMMDRPLAILFASRNARPLPVFCTDWCAARTSGPVRQNGAHADHR